MVRPMEAEDGVVAEIVTGIAHRNLFQRNLHLLPSSVDFRRIQSREILILSSKTSRYVFIMIKGTSNTASLRFRTWLGLSLGKLHGSVHRPLRESFVVFCFFTSPPVQKILGISVNGPCALRQKNQRCSWL